MNTEKKRNRENTVRGILLHRTGLLFKIILCILAMLLGLYMIFTENDMWLIYLIIDELTALGITYLLYFFVFKAIIKNKYLLWTVTVLIFFSLCNMIDSLGEYFVTGLTFVTGIFGILTGLILFLNFLRQVHDRTRFMRSLIWSLIYLGIGYFLITSRNGTVDFTVFVGFYILTFAWHIFRQSFHALTKVTSKKREVNRKMITLPTIISAFIPIGFFRNLSTTVKAEDCDKTLFLEEEEEETDLTIYIHTRAGLVPGFGHVDICFDGKVYCYGNYDENTWIMGGFLSDGVLATTTPENHIKNALTNDKKVLIAYDLKISEKTKEKIKKQIDKMMQKAYRWKPDAELAAEGKLEGNPEDYTDVASLMYLEENTELYKFEKGSPYKTYYLLGQNCAMVANEIVGHSGIKLLRLNRIVTPGSYLEYLDQLYNMKHTIVVDRNVYMLNDNGKPYLLSPEDEKKLEHK